MNIIQTILGARKSASMILFILLASMVLTACNDEAENIDEVNKQTVLVFLPWSGSNTHTGLLPEIKANLDSIETSIVGGKGLDGTRALVYFCETANSATLYEITFNEQKNVCEHTTLKTYTGHDYTTAEGMKAILEDMKSMAPALNYAMMVGCHGTGWTYTDSWEKYPYYAKPFSYEENDGSPQTRAYVSNGEDPETRFYGSVDDIKTFSTDIPTLVEAIKQTGIKMQFIMFDDCYMANVEVAYQLRDVTNFLIASTCEVMAIGFPYQTMFPKLANWQPNYTSAIDAFGDFYKNYVYPFGTAAAIDCRKMEELAAAMKAINNKYTFDETLLDSIQVLDGFKTHVFYDFGDYVDHLCPERALKNRIESALSNAVTRKACTDEFYTNLYGYGYSVKINKFSGLTISDPSQSSVVKKSIQRTDWYKATH